MQDLLALNQPAIPVAYIRLLVEVLAERGFSRDQALRGTSLSAEQLEQADTRLTAAQFGRVLANALAFWGEPTLAYEVGLRTPVTAHGFLGYAVLSCATLREAIELGARFFRLRTTLISIGLREEGEAAVVEVMENVDFGPLRAFAVESLMVTLARVGNGITAQDFAGLELWFDYPEPPYYAAYRDRLPPMRFDQASLQLRFQRQQLDRPLAMADPLAVRQAVDQCERELALVSDHQSTQTRVAALLAQCQSRYPDLTDLARKLHMSPRTLKRRLQQEGTSFQHLLDAARQRDATRLLANPSLTLEQVAELLGYADPANFTRAFRKWTGVPPSLHRRRLVEGN